MSIFGVSYDIPALIERIRNAKLEEHMEIKNYFDCLLSKYEFLVTREKKYFTNIIQTNETILKYTTVKDMYYKEEGEMTVINLKKDEDIQFDKYIGANISSVFTLQRYLGLELDVIERALRNESTRIMYDGEILDTSCEDIIEYNRIILMKRLAFVLNYITHFMLVEIKDEKINEVMGFKVINGMIISNKFYDSKICRFKHEKISVYFNGQIHSGSWYVDELIEKYQNEDIVLFIPEESVYPLNLCLKVDGINMKYMNIDEGRVTDVMNLDWRGRMIKITLNDAIPGSGKTYTMKKQIKEMGIEQCLVIVPTREEVVELRNEGFKAYTIDGLHKRMICYNKNNNFNNLIKNIGYLFVDECFMIHSGQLRWILKKIRTITFYDEVFCFGDRGQIPYYSYVNLKIEHQRDIFSEVSKIKDMNSTFRCPKIMKQFLENIYQRTVNMESVYLGEIKRMVYSFHYLRLAVQRLDYEKYKILTFTQAEKEEIKNKFQLKNVITIGESQGQTYQNVVLVRMNQYDRVIYTQKSHINVALTRFKEKFIYLTVKEDYLCKVIESINNNTMDKFEIETQNMLLGTYMIESTTQRIISNDVVEELQGIKSYERICFDNQIYLNKDRLQMNEQDIDIMIERIQNTFAKFAASRERRFLDSNEVLERVIELKGELEEVSIKFNERKFHSILEKENLEMKRFNEQNVLQIGEFVANEAPEARIDKQRLLYTLGSIKKRNADPSKLRNFMMTLNAEHVVNSFFEVFVDSEKWESMAVYREEFSKDFLEEWKSTRDSQQLNKLAFEHCNLNNIDFTEYHSFIKTITKNQLGSDAYEPEKVAQVVAGAHAIMVEYFTPMVKQFSLLLKKVLKDNVLINDGVTVEQMEYFVNSRISEKRIGIVPVEMDYSKFDKNQDWIDLYYQMLIMRKFGVPDWICSEWISVHLITQLRFAKYGIVVPTLFQRKSGDAFTFMGNTLFTMIMYSVYYNKIKFEVALFGGDDSLVLYNKEEHSKIIDYGEEIAAAFNMEIKYLDTTKSVMFASRFFVFTEEHVYILPDIIKQIVRYKRTLETQEHALAQQMSSAILNQNIYNLSECVFRKYLQMMFERYKFEEENAQLWSSIIMDYLILLYHGKTYLMYRDFFKLPHADEGTMRHLKKHLLKKVNSEQINQFTCRNNLERKFINNVNKSIIKIQNEINQIKELSIKPNKYDSLKQIKIMYMSSLLSWFDVHKIQRSNIFKNLYVKYNIETLNKVGLEQKKEENIFTKILNLVNCLNPFKNRNVTKHTIYLEKQMVYSCDLGELEKQLLLVNDTVYRNTGYKFEVDIVVYERDNSVNEDEVFP